MKFVIESVDNGYIVTLSNEGEKDAVYVFEQEEYTAKSEALTISNILNHILTAMENRTNSRYASHRVSISIEPGDKYVPGDFPY